MQKMDLKTFQTRPFATSTSLAHQEEIPTLVLLLWARRVDPLQKVNRLLSRIYLGNMAGLGRTMIWNDLEGK